MHEGVIYGKFTCHILHPLPYFTPICHILHPLIDFFKVFYIYEKVKHNSYKHSQIYLQIVNHF